MRSSRLMLALGLMLFVVTSEAQTYTRQHIEKLISNSEKDSIARIERLAALKFHQLINAYRKENGLKEMAWNEVIWVATINHNTWMKRAGNLSHHQKTNTHHFTGVSPGDRLKYAEAGESNMGWTGENALYNFSAHGSTIEEIAQNIASRSFKQWKNSPGHNQNMLSKRHGSHAVAFKITADQVWGTDLFSAADANYKEQSGDYLAVQSSRKRVKHFSTFKNKRLLEDELSAQMFAELNVKKRNWSKKGGEAKSKAHRIARKQHDSNRSGLVYTQVNKRIESRFLGLVRREIQTFIVTVQNNLDDFDVESVSGALTALLKQNQVITSKSKIDQAIVLKRRRNKVYVTLVNISSNPIAKS